jgi:hypothetical protein
MLVLTPFVFLPLMLAPLVLAPAISVILIGPYGNGRQHHRRYTSAGQEKQ